MDWEKRVRAFATGPTERRNKSDFQRLVNDALSLAAPPVVKQLRHIVGRLGLIVRVVCFTFV